MGISEELLERIELSLNAGRVEAAVTAAQQYFEEAPDKTAAAFTLGEILRRLYRDMHVEAIHEFHDVYIADMNGPWADELLKAIKPDIDLTIEWKKRLDSLANERLANDIADYIKAKNQPAAEETAKNLIFTADSEEGRAARAKQIGYILGGLVHERDRAQAFVKSMSRAPQKFGIDGLVAVDVEEQFQKAAVHSMRRERIAGAMSRVELTQTTVELSRTLPQRMAIHEPTPEDYVEFDRHLRAVIRCCLLSYNMDRYHEATLLMVEFSPKELSTAGALAGVEQRLHGTLGRTARMVAAKVFSDIGSNRRVFTSYMEFTRSHLRDRTGRYAVEVLGLLQNHEAVAFLMQVMADKKTEARVEAVFALGAIADERAQHVLLQGLSTDLRNKIIEGKERRDAFAIISSLGRIARGLSVGPRSHLVSQVVRLLPKDDTEFLIRAALNFFAGKVEGMDPALLKWAARVGTSTLWSFDRPELARAGKTSPLGFRQPLIDMLERLAPHTLETINATAAENVKSFGAAYLAMGELYTKVGNDSSLPILEQMIFHTLLGEGDKPRSEYVKDMILDTTTDEKIELSSDKILSTLIYAVDKIGGDRAVAILEDLYERIQLGSIPPPGRETSDFLMQAHMRNAQRAGRSAFVRPEEIPPLSVEDQLEDAMEVGRVSLTPEDLEAMKDLEAHYLIAGKRRQKKVAAMAVLAQRKILDAIPIIMKHLSDADSIISASAVTALVDMGSGNAPARVLDNLSNELLHSLQTADTNTRVKIAEVLLKVGPRRSPFREKIETLSSNSGLPLAVRSILNKIKGEPPAGKPAPAAASAAPGAVAAGDFPGASIADIPVEKSPGHELVEKYMPKATGADVTDLDKKHAYMKARQEWIRNGKRGPEPVLPQ